MKLDSWGMRETVNKCHRIMERMVQEVAQCQGECNVRCPLTMGGDNNVNDFYLYRGWQSGVAMLPESGALDSSCSMPHASTDINNTLHVQNNWRFVEANTYRIEPDTP